MFSLTTKYIKLLYAVLKQLEFPNILSENALFLNYLP